MHSGDTEFELRAGVWAIIIGSLGIPIGVGVAVVVGIDPRIGAILGGAIGGGGVYFLTLFITRQAGAVAGSIYHPSGESTPPKREYSHAASLVMLSRYEEAIAAYELHCLQHPEDPEPYLKLAGLYRDHLGRFQDAIRCLQQCRRQATLTAGRELQIVQDLVELYTEKLRQPRRAITELAYLVERFPDGPGTDSARQELSAMRALLAREQAGEGSFDDLFYASLEEVRGRG